jgi:hypothetical protein
MDGQLSQTGVSDFGRTRIDLAEEDDCSMLCFDDENDDDDDTNDEYDDQDLLLDF